MFTYTYDDEGNRLTKVRKSTAAADDKTVEYAWDYRNRLEKVTYKRNDGTVTKTVDLRYDFANRLTQRALDPDGALGSATVESDDYFWDGAELVGVYGYRSLVFASGPAQDMVLFESAASLHALLGDHLGTIRDVVSTGGTVENHLVYNSYGELVSQTGGGAYSPFFGFTGKHFDTAVGLQYNLNRWYDAATGRWASEDPIGFGGGHANLNVYTGNSPVNRTDPVGLNPAIPDNGVLTFQARGQDLEPPFIWLSWENFNPSLNVTGVLSDGFYEVDVFTHFEQGDFWGTLQNDLWQVGGQMEGPYGTVIGNFGTQGGGITLTIPPINSGPGPFNIGGPWTGTLGITIGSNPIYTPMPGPLTSDPVPPSGPITLPGLRDEDEPFIRIDLDIRR